MENKPIEIDSTTFVDKVKEKVKNQFLDIIPEESWDSMIKNEIDGFFEGNMYKSFEIQSGSGWNKNSNTITVKEGISPFRVIVWEHCFEKVKNHVNQNIVQDFMSQEIGKQGELNEKTKEVVQEAIPLAIQKYFEGMINNMGQNFVNMIQNNSNNVY